MHSNSFTNSLEDISVVLDMPFQEICRMFLSIDNILITQSDRDDLKQYLNLISEKHKF